MPKSKSKRKKPQRAPRPSRERKTVVSSDASSGPSETPKEHSLSTNGYHVPKLPVTAEGITDRMEGFFQVASVLPFFVTAWIAAGIQVKEVFLFSLFFGSMILGSIVHSAKLRGDAIPFPEQLYKILAAALVVICLWAYSETGSVEVLVLLGGAGVLRFLSNLIEVERPATVFW